MTPFLQSFVLALILSTTHAVCTSQYFQRGTSDTEWLIYSYNHNDWVCATDQNYQRKKLQADTWRTISAQQNGQNTIQVDMMYIHYGSVAGKADKQTDFFVCDDITRSSKCTGRTTFKSGCNKYYVVHMPEETGANYPKICKAEVGSNGDPLLDADGLPYGLCDSCKHEYKDDRRLGGLLRGS